MTNPVDITKTIRFANMPDGSVVFFPVGRKEVRCSPSFMTQVQLNDYQACSQLSRWLGLAFPSRAEWEAYVREQTLQRLVAAYEPSPPKPQGGLTVFMLP